MSGPHDVMSGPHEGTFEALRAQLQEAAATFADGPDALEGILPGIVDDVDRAVREPLEIFPVCHHSPASALAMARRLREKQPKVVYLELCEDLAPLLTELRNCRLPVAVQAFASELDGFPAEWAPLSVVAPITEASAEYQAIAYALDTPGVELVLVDRSSDHVFQWDARGSHTDDAAEPGGPAEGGRVRPGHVTRRGGGRAARRRGRRGDRRPAATLRRAGGAPAAPRQGAALVGVVAPVRRTAARRQRPRHLPAGHAPDRQPVPAAGPRRPPSGAGGRGPRALHVDPDARAPGRVRHRSGGLPLRLRRLPRGQPGRGVRRPGHRHLRHQPAQRHDLAARPDPVQPRGDRGAVRPRRRLGVDRRDGLGEERPAHPRGAVPAGGTGGHQEVEGQEEGRPGTRRGPPALGPADRLPSATARPGQARRGRTARLVRGDRARRAPQRLPRLHRRRHRGVRDVDPAGRDARPGQAHAVRLPGRGRHLHREGQRAGPARRAPSRGDPAGRRPDRPGRLRRAAAAGPRRPRPARAAGPEAPATRGAAGAAGHRRRGRSWGAAPTCCGCCGI